MAQLTPLVSVTATRNFDSLLIPTRSAERRWQPKGPWKPFGTEGAEAHSRGYANISAAARRGSPRGLRPRHGYSQTPRNRLTATAAILTLHNTACRAWMGPPERGRAPRHWGVLRGGRTPSYQTPHPRPVICRFPRDVCDRCTTPSHLVRLGIGRRVRCCTGDFSCHRRSGYFV